MNKKLKILTLSFFTIFLCLIFNVSIFALESEIKEVSTERYDTGNGINLPYWTIIKDSHDGIVKKVWLYDYQLNADGTVLNNPATPGLNGYTFVLYTGADESDAYNQTNYRYIFGQMFNWTVSHNNNNPTDLTPVKDSSNFNAMFSVLYNRQNKAGISYINTRGKTYPLKYPASITWPLNPITYTGGYTVNPITYNLEYSPKDNWNFKQANQTTIVPNWLTSTSGIEGMARYVFAPNARDEYARSYMFTNDIDNTIIPPELYASDIIYQPWNTLPSLPMDKGQVNKDFDDLDRNPNEEMIFTYQVTRSVYPDLANIINAFKGESVYKRYTTELERETAVFLDYFAVRTYASDKSYAQIEMKNGLDHGTW